MTGHDAAKTENQNLHIYMSVEILANRSIWVGLNSKLAELNRAQLFHRRRTVVPKIDHD